jgi:hypothetical protein
MAFALTNAKLYKVDTSSPIDKRGLQAVELTITRGSSDTDLDIGDTAGTFWADAIADATYGDQAQKCLDAYKTISGEIEAVASCEVTAANGFLLRVASVSAVTQYQLVNGATFPEVEPEIVLNSGAAPATLKVTLLLSLFSDKNTVDFTF